MKLYDFGLAASAHRVRMFIAEKNLKIEMVEVDVRSGKQYEEPYCSKNPFGVVPTLELDDGTCIAESIAICRYLEELHPEPALFGENAVQRATIEMWNRRIELDGLGPATMAVRNTLPLFEGRVIAGTRSDTPQSADVAKRGVAMLEVLLSRLNTQLENRVFVTGDVFSIADITAYFVLRSAKLLEVDLENRYTQCNRLLTTLNNRPSSDS